jgi:hypothetical protein
MGQLAARHVDDAPAHAAKARIEAKYANGLHGNARTNRDRQFRGLQGIGATAPTAACCTIPICAT